MDWVFLVLIVVIREESGILWIKDEIWGFLICIMVKNMWLVWCIIFCDIFWDIYFMLKFGCKLLDILVI